MQCLTKKHFEQVAYGVLPLRGYQNFWVRRHFAPRHIAPKDKMPQDKMPQGHFAPTCVKIVDILPQLFFCIFLWHILCISCAYLGHILRTSRAYLGHILDISQAYLERILGIFCCGITFAALPVITS